MWCRPGRVGGELELELELELSVVELLVFFGAGSPGRGFSGCPWLAWFGSGSHGFINYYNFVLKFV